MALEEGFIGRLRLRTVIGTGRETSGDWIAGWLFPPPILPANARVERVGDLWMSAHAPAGPAGRSSTIVAVAVVPDRIAVVDGDLRR